MFFYKSMLLLSLVVHKLLATVFINFVHLRKQDTISCLSV